MAAVAWNVSLLRDCLAAPRQTFVAQPLAAWANSLLEKRVSLYNNIFIVGDGDAVTGYEKRQKTL